MKNFHLHLPDRTHTDQQRRKSRRDEIAAYATEIAGTHLDLDPDLESAAIEHLVKTGKPAK